MNLLLLSTYTYTSHTSPIMQLLFLYISILFACIVGSEHDGRIMINRHRNFFNNPKSLLTDDQLDSYIKDGFIVISGLLDTNEISNLVNAGESLISKKSADVDGKLSSGNYQVHEFGLVFNDSARAFRDVALYSKLPSVVAELLQLDSRSHNLRVLR